MTLRDRFRGALLGTFVGDALGMPLEGRRRRSRRQGIVREMLEDRLGRGTYTDDTQMTIALAQALVDTRGSLDLDRVAALFSDHYERRRGYGANARAILVEIGQGAAWQDAVAAHSLPGGGSYANGAAMRVAPIALAMYPNEDAVGHSAEEQALVTGHGHPVGRFGARVQALAVLHAITSGEAGAPFPAYTFLRDVLAACPDEFRAPLTWLGDHLDAPLLQAAEAIGTWSQAQQSVPMALWCFLSAEGDPEEALVRSVNAGGDADTIGAMTGAIVGGHHGASALPRRWVEVLENGPLGRDHVLALADQLYDLTRGRSEDRHRMKGTAP